MAQEVLNDQLIAKVVHEVLTRLGTAQSANPAPSSVVAESGSNLTGGFGVYSRMEDAIAAAQKGFEKLNEGGFEARKKAIAEIRKLCVAKAQEWGRLEFEETKIGRLAHKIDKLAICAELVPGTEFLRRDAFSGDHGLTVIEYAPWGVIGAVTPVTHSVPTLTGNAINMVAAGNSVVFNTHPNGSKCAAIAIRAYNEAIFKATGISDLLCTVEKPTLETFDLMCKSPTVRLLCVTGGPAVVKAAMLSGKRAVCAGPGNPPVVVDETANLESAAQAIIQGASFDNNLLCIGEKEVFVVEKVADALISALKKNGAVQLTRDQVEKLTQVAFTFPEGQGAGCAHASVNKKFVGKDASFLAEAIGLSVPASTLLLFGETNESHAFVQEEQMMPFIPIVRVKDFDAAVAAAVRAEHGYKHTMVIHSLNIVNMTKMGVAADTTLYIKNGPSMSGLGLGGEGFLSFSVATPTGEGVTTPMTFTRSRRCVMVDNLNII
ncbi:MAG: aldehyde dehydrogenase family protein [Verrucomicrobiota bacterium]|nr:aldehyde dehydrogenase family protein [Verrucomicrobiota bacterium]